MKTIDVLEFGKKVETIEIKKLISEVSDEVLYQAIVARLSHDRLGNAFTLTKSEVSGGGRKPWRQKGLGRARAGSIRSPLWRGGGVIFGPKPRDLSKDLNKKQKALAYVTLFTKLYEAGKLKVIKDFEFKDIKTKVFVDFLKKIGGTITKKTTLINKDYNKNLYLSSRNIQKINVKYLDNIDLLDLFYADEVFITKSAIIEFDNRIEKILG